MTVIFTMNDKNNRNEDTLFVGCYDDMESCKQAILKHVNEYIEVNIIFSEDEIRNDESYYVVFDENTKEEKKKFFVKNFELKATVEVTELQ